MQCQIKNGPFLCLLASVHSLFLSLSVVKQQHSAAYLASDLDLQLRNDFHEVFNCPTLSVNECMCVAETV